MAYTVAELITRSLYLSGIVARGYSTPTGQQLNDGLFLLNDLLSFQTVDMKLIPYFKKYEFDMEIGEGTYFVPSLVNLETMTYIYSNNVRYSMIEQSREEFFGTPRTENIQSLPGYYHMEKAKGGANVYVYYLPDQAYPATIWGRFGLDLLPDVPASYEVDLLLTYDRFYLNYLRHLLGDYFCSEYGYNTPPQTKQELEKIIAKLQDLSPMDFTTQKMSTLQRGVGYNWGMINLSDGWTT